MVKYFVIKLVGNESYLNSAGAFLPYDHHSTLNFLSIEGAEGHIKNGHFPSFCGVRPALTIVEIYK